MRAIAWAMLLATTVAGCDDNADVVEKIPAAGGGAGAGPDAAVGGSAGTAGVAGSAGDAGDPFAAIGASMQAEMEEGEIPGAAIAIVVDGQMVWSAGFNRTGYDVKATTLFRSGTAGTVLTAIAALQLVDEQKLDLDDAVVDHIPGMHIDGPSVAPLSDMKVRHAMVKATGLPFSIFASGTWLGNEDSNLTGYFASDSFAQKAKLAYPPGRLMDYTRLDSPIVGAVVEIVSQQGFKQRLREKVLTPLGMTRTLFAPDEVASEDDLMGGGDAICDSCLMQTAFGSYMSVHDAAKLGAFLVNGNESVLSEAQRNELLKGHIADTMPKVQGAYGMGMVTDGLYVPDSVYPYPFSSAHWRGAWCGQSQMLTVIPGRKFALATFAWSPNWKWFPKTLLLAARTLLNLPDIEPLKPAVDDPATYGKYVGDYQVFGKSTPYTVAIDVDGLRVTGNGLDCYLEPLGPGYYRCGIPWMFFYLDEQNEHVEYMRYDYHWVGQKVEASDAGTDAPAD